MGANTFGHYFRMTSFGESHGPGLGVVIDGCPAQVPFDEGILKRELERRRPGGGFGTQDGGIVSSRREPDIPEILSGVFQGQTLGTPIAILVRNRDCRPEDYQLLDPSCDPNGFDSSTQYHMRSGHGDATWRAKFGHVDPRGGGRSSGRETLSRVIGGAIAQMILRSLVPDLEIVGYTLSVGPYEISEKMYLKIHSGDKGKGNPDEDLHLRVEDVDKYPSRCPESSIDRSICELLRQAKGEGESYGGVAEILIRNLPPGLGQPVFHKLKSDLAGAFMGIGAVQGVELGEKKFSEEEFSERRGQLFHSSSRSYGGILGGISTGEPIVYRVHFKPTSSLGKWALQGRHDPCIIPRAIPVLEAMAWVTLLDHWLWRQQDRLDHLDR